MSLKPFNEPGEGTWTWPGTGIWPRDFPTDPKAPPRDAQPVRPFANPGWTCPVCGRGNAPSTSTCPCVPPPPVRVSF